jgi:hypothetical protein
VAADKVQQTRRGASEGRPSRLSWPEAASFVA